VKENLNTLRWFELFFLEDGFGGWPRLLLVFFVPPRESGMLGIGGLTFGREKTDRFQ
jgi:hypothetical protein